MEFILSFFSEKKGMQVMEEHGRLYQRLIEYGKSDFYPFHMPGHKRACQDNSFFSGLLPYQMDITEIDGFDDLHHPEEILKECMEHAAEVFECDELFYLVNGSSCGNLAAIFAVCQENDKIIVARNSHKSIYHAIALRHLQPIYLSPKENQEYGFFEEIGVEQVQEIIDKHQDAKAVVLTSPTYEGIVSDIKAISELVHQAGMKLIVDEAHGAHFGFGTCFFPSAVCLGADLVINSIHKTLNGMTQTAILKMNTKNMTTFEAQDYKKRVQRYLGFFESSSPSYVLMASIDECVYVMEHFGKQLCREYEVRMQAFYKKTEGLRILQVARLQNQDITKVIISIRKWRIKQKRENNDLIWQRYEQVLSGAGLSEILRRCYHLEMEMAAYDYVIAMTSIFDSEEGIERLAEALWDIEDNLRKDGITWWITILKNTEDVDKIGTKVKKEKLKQEIQKRRGKVSENFVYVYPPGIPMLVPGEVYTDAICDELLDKVEKGLNVRING